jgi:beta-carotene 3-hydroxylase
MFEANDWYAAIFAIPSILLFLWGIGLGHGAGYAWVGGGIAAYGAIYFGFHDVIVAQAHRSPLCAAIDLYEAHRPGSPAAHAVETKRGTVSFGFLWAPRPEVLKAELKRLKA